MPLPNSAAIDAGLVTALLADTGPGGLMTLLPDGVYFDVAPPGAKRCVVVAVVEHRDVPVLGGRGYESVVYRVRALILSTSGVDANAAEARIQALLEDQPLTATGYTWMTTYREERIREMEPDEKDLSIRWQHRGGLYRVEMSLDVHGQH